MWFLEWWGSQKCYVQVWWWGRNHGKTWLKCSGSGFSRGGRRGICPWGREDAKLPKLLLKYWHFLWTVDFCFLGLKKTTTNHIYLSFSFSVGVCGRHSVCVRAPGAWIPRWQILQKSIWRAVRLLTYRMSRAKRTVQKLNIALEHLNCSGIWLKCFLPPCSCCYKSSFSDTLSLS